MAGTEAHLYDVRSEPPADEQRHGAGGAAICDTTTGCRSGIMYVASGDVAELADAKFRIYRPEMITNAGHAGSIPAIPTALICVYCFPICIRAVMRHLRRNVAGS